MTTSTSRRPALRLVPPLPSVPPLPTRIDTPWSALGAEAATLPFVRPRLCEAELPRALYDDPLAGVDPTEVMQRLPWEDDPPPPAPTAMPLPPQGRLWRRMWAHPRLMHFHRLMALVVLGNVALVIALGHLPWTGAPRAAIATLTSLVVGNLGLAIIVRQQYVINLLFWLATRAPTSWPLWIRATLAKVYHFGGLHVGGAIAATAWYAALVYVVLAHGGASTAATTIAIVQLVLLVAIATISMPQFRARHHDTFEIVKRFGGWASLILFWAHAVVFARDELAPGASLAYALVTSWQTWVLAAATLSVALPWMRLRKVPVELVVPSKHVALARFDYGVTPFAGSSTAISRSPLREWHSFANVPWPDRPGYRLTISRAGDWTGALIDDKPSHVWVKGIPTAGVANIEVLFKRVVYVATGSGIGPCLPHLLAQKVPASLVWATRDPRATYGDELVDEILAVQPDAQIIDTHKQGKPDLVALAYQAAVATGAEAVICISNKKLTWEVVYGLESRGIPAYGAIWDS